MDPSFADGGTLAPFLALLLCPGWPRLNKNEANFFHRGSHCAIC